MLKSVIWFGVGRSIPAGTLIVSFYLLHSRYGADWFAGYSLFFAVVAFAATMSSAWAVQALLRYGPASSFAASFSQAYFRSRQISALLSGLVAFGAFGLVCYFSGSFNIWSIVLAGFAAYWQAFHLVTLAQLQARRRPSAYAKVEICRGTAVSILPILSNYAFGSNAIYSQWALVGAWLLASSVSSWVAANDPQILAVTDSLKQDSASPQAWLKKFASFGMPMTVWAGLFSALPVMDRSMQTTLIGAPSAGNYALAFEVFYKATVLLLFPVTMALNPIVMSSRSAQLSKEMVRKLNVIAATMISVSVLVACIVWLAGGLISNRYEPIMELNPLPSWGLVGVLIVAAGAWQACLVMQKSFEFEGRQVVLVKALFIALVLYFIVTSLTLREHGLAASAYALLGLPFIYIGLVNLLGGGILGRGLRFRQ